LPRECESAYGSFVVVSNGVLRFDPAAWFGWLCRRETKPSLWMSRAHPTLRRPPSPDKEAMAAVAAASAAASAASAVATKRDPSPPRLGCRVRSKPMTSEEKAILLKGLAVWALFTIVRARARALALGFHSHSHSITRTLACSRSQCAKDAACLLSPL
jgi:hypothetical protein